MLTPPQAINDQREIDERDEHDIEFFKPGEDAPKSLEPTEQPFDLVASRIQGSIVFPRRESIVLGRYHRYIASLHRQLPPLIAFIRSIHEQGDRMRSFSEALQQLAPLRGIVGLAWGQGKREGRSSIRSNRMNRGRPSAPGLTNGVRAVCLTPPCHPDGP